MVLQPDPLPLPECQWAAPPMTLEAPSPGGLGGASPLEGACGMCTPITLGALFLGA